jgi:hypothetical protein
MGTTPSSPGSQPTKSLSSADLAFIDAAIAMQKAATQLNAQPAAAAGTAEPALFIGVIQLVVAVVEVATFVYHAVKGRVPIFNTLTASSPEQSASASLPKLIAARNELAKSLGDSSVLK